MSILARKFRELINLATRTAAPSDVDQGDIWSEDDGARSILKYFDGVDTKDISQGIQGPSSSTDNALARWDAGTGNLIQDSTVIVSDAGAMTGITDLTASGTVTATTLTGTVSTASQPNIDHDSLLNFVTNEHIDHTTVDIATAAADGLSGGGDISATRNIAVQINGVTDLPAPAVGDELLISDIDNSNALRKADLASIVNLADHDQLINFVGNDHIDHTTVDIATAASTSGLSGGGDISATRNIAIDINGTGDLATPAIDDELLLADTDDSNNLKKADIASIVNLADHDALTNFVANQHVDHTTVEIATAANTSGLTGGGDITATRNIAVDINGTSDKATPIAADEIILADSADSNNNKKADIGSMFNAIYGATVTAAQLTSVALADNQAAAADVVTFDDAQTAIVADYSLIRGSANVECGQLYITNDGSTANVALSASTTGSLGVTFSADISGGTVRLRYTSTSTGTAPTFQFSSRTWAS